MVPWWKHLLKSSGALFPNRLSHGPMQGIFRAQRNNSFYWEPPWTLVQPNAALSAQPCTKYPEICVTVLPLSRRLCIFLIFFVCVCQKDYAKNTNTEKTGYGPRKNPLTFGANSRKANLGFFFSFFIVKRIFYWYFSRNIVEILKNVGLFRWLIYECVQLGAAWLIYKMHHNTITWWTRSKHHCARLQPHSTTTTHCWFIFPHFLLLNIESVSHLLHFKWLHFTDSSIHSHPPYIYWCLCTILDLKRHSVTLEPSWGHMTHSLGVSPWRWLSTHYSWGVLFVCWWGFDSVIPITD